MNSKKVKNKIGPVFVISTFIAISYFISSFFDVMSWRDIMTLGVIEVLCFYAITKCGFDINRSRILCTILALQIVFYSLPYMISAWVFINFNIGPIDAVFDVLFEGYNAVSVVIAILLLTVSIWPERSLDEFADLVRADFYLNRINERFGVYLFSVKSDVQWKR